MKKSAPVIDEQITSAVNKNNKKIVSNKNRANDGIRPETIIQNEISASRERAGDNRAVPNVLK